MKIEKINENKIKVLIDDNEAREWNISFKNIAENTPEVQEMFWKAIRLAEKNVDFSVDGAKLFVEAVPGSEEDGFGMLITRVCNDDELNQAISSCSYKGKLKRSELRPAARKGVRRCIYRFSDFDTVCAAAGEISGFYAGKSALYKCEEMFYLCLAPENNAVLWDTELILSEFGIKVRSCQYMQGRLNEYGEQLIAESAVEVMEEYFCIR